MPTTPYAQILVSVNGGPLLSGLLTVTNTNVVQCSAANVTGWINYRWEIYDYPVGFTLPSGWADDGTGVFYSLVIVPPTFTIPASPLWGKFALRLRINEALTNSKAADSLTDVATILQVFSPGLGMEDIAQLESNQGHKTWLQILQADLRLLDGLVVGGGGGPPTGAANGDLSGTYPNPGVAKIHGGSVPLATGMTTGNGLYASGAAAFTLSALNLAGGSGWVTGQLPLVNFAPGSNGQVLDTAGGVASWVTPAGDVTGAPTAFVVGKLKGTTITTAGGSLAVGGVLRVTGVATADWGPLDLADSDAVTGVLDASHIPAGASVTMAGDVTGPSGTTVVVQIHGATVPIAGALTVGNLLQVTGASALGYGPLNLAGGANFVTGVLPAANVPAISALSGTLPFSATSGTVPLNRGGTGATALASGVIHSNGSVLSSSPVVDGDISPGVAGSKVVPAFGSQNISTTGTLNAGATTVAALTDTALGVGVVHSSAGGAFTSSLVDLATDVTGVLPLASLATIAPFDTVNHGGSRTLKGISATEFASLNARSVVWSESVRDFFRWVPGSTVTADDITCCNPTVNGANPGRFERLNLASPAWMRQLEWCVRPSTGHDENVGTIASPLATDDERLRRMGGSGTYWDGGAYHLYYPENVAMFSILGRRSPSSTIFVHANVTPGQGLATLYSGTIDTLVAANYVAQPWALTSTGIPTSWTVSALIGARGRLTSGAHSGAKFWPVVDAGSKTAWLSEPIAADPFTIPYNVNPVPGSPSATDTFVVESLVAVTNVVINMVAARGTNTAGVVLEGFDIGSGGKLALSGNDRIVFDGCILQAGQSVMFDGAIYLHSCRNKMTAGTGEQSCTVLLVVGGYADGGAQGCDYSATNILLCKDYMQVGTRTKWACSESTEGGARITGRYAVINGTAGPGSIEVCNRMQLEAAAVIWGTGSTVPIFDIYRGQALNFAGLPAAGNVTLTTSAATDVRLADQNTARPFDPVTGLYAGPIAITWANFIATILSGGFGGQINDPVSGCVMGRSI